MGWRLKLQTPCGYRSAMTKAEARRFHEHRWLLETAFRRLRRRSDGMTRFVATCALSRECLPQMKPVRFKLWLAFAALGLVWGTTWVASDNLAEQVPPLLAAAVRYLLAALFLLPVILLKRLKLPRGRSLVVVADACRRHDRAALGDCFCGRGTMSNQQLVTVSFAAMPLLVAC